MKRLICILLTLAVLACLPAPANASGEGPKGSDRQTGVQPIADGVLIPIDEVTVPVRDEQQSAAPFRRLRAVKKRNSEENMQKNLSRGSFFQYCTGSRLMSTGSPSRNTTSKA